jgi:hypothetical protein
MGSFFTNPLRFRVFRKSPALFITAALARRWDRRKLGGVQLLMLSRCVLLPYPQPERLVMVWA